MMTNTAPSVQPSLPQRATIPNLAQLLKAAGDELRLAILQVLATDSYGVLELAKAFDTKQSGMSHHLKVLATAGLVGTRREGNSIFYRRTILSPDDPLKPSKQSIFEQADQLPIASVVQYELNDIWDERAKASQKFFLENANAFKEQQDLIANFEVYRPQVTELLQLTPLNTLHQALEIGPGEGDFLHELSNRFQRVLALDSSAEMLSIAKSSAQEQHLSNVQFEHGDTSKLNTHPLEFNCAVINMVLHHTPSPAQVFQDVSNALKSGATLLITELCLHDQAWTQKACGDVWLGFDPDDLTRWAQEAFFKEGQSTYFALRNGFQIQVRQFFKN